MCLKEHKNNERENASINSLASKNLYLLPLPELQADDRIREKATQEKGKMGNHTPCGFTANTLFHCRMTNCIEHTLPPTPIPLSPTHTAPAICHSQLQLLPWTFYFFIFLRNAPLYHSIVPNLGWMKLFQSFHLNIPLQPLFHLLQTAIGQRSFSWKYGHFIFFLLGSSDYIPWAAVCSGLKWKVSGDIHFECRHIILLSDLLHPISPGLEYQPDLGREFKRRKF